MKPEQNTRVITDTLKHCFRINISVNVPTFKEIITADKEPALSEKSHKQDKPMLSCI